jgi:hypothetical protein
MSMEPMVAATSFSGLPLGDHVLPSVPRTAENAFRSLHSKAGKAPDHRAEADKSRGRPTKAAPAADTVQIGLAL